MTRANEFTPLLVGEEDVFRPPGRRRSVWQLVLTGALSLGVLSLFQQRRSPVDVSVDVADAIVSLETEDAAFLSSMEAYKDPSVDPCVDFYQYACGGWLSSHEIPSDRPSIDSSFYVVSETNKDTIQRIFDQKPPQINQLYQSCLNDQEVDATAVAFVAELIENVHLANSTIALMEYAGEMDQSLGISSFFSLFVGADPQDPTINVLQLAQGGLTLPSREYYLEESKVEAYAELFVDYATKLFAVGDLDKHNVSEYAHAVLETETSFAKISLSNAALRNPWTTSTAYPFADIAQRYPFLMAYLNGIYKKEPFPMLHAIVATPDFFEAQNELLKDESLLPQLKNYLSFHLIDSFGAILGEYFRRASHEFHGTIQGAGALLPREQFCVRLTTTFLGDEIGEYYMKDVFGPDAKAAAQSLVAEIEESLKALLTTEAWLDKVTYEAAVGKLEKVKNYIGGPDEVPPLPFALQADAFFNNVKSLMQLGATGTIQAINEPVNEQAWDMFPSTVNAYYDPSANKMVFPAAILQPPFYSAEHYPAAANFARIGMVMGHELSHGFDDQGRNYDGNGALRSWWTPSVSAEFAQKAQCLSAQYSNFPVVSIEDGRVLGTVNGNLTLGENIADNGGIHLAYEAYQLWKSTFASPPETPSSPADSNDTPEPTESAPAPMPVETAPTPEPTETIPAVVSPPEVQPPEPTPNEDTPAVTLAPVVPIPDVPVPEPTETGPGEQIPAVTLPPPVLPVPEAETPEPVQTSPSGEIPVGTPQPDIGPGEVIPEETLPAPTETASPAESPVVTLPPSPGPTPEQQTPVPSEPPSEVSTSPPVVPVPVPVPVPESTHEPPTSSPPVKTKPADVTPNPVASETSPDKHKHKKEKEEPEVKEPSEKSKHHESESEKDKTHERTKPKDEESVKHPSDKKKEKEEKKEHGDGNEDEGEKSSKHSGQRSKDEEDGKHEKHRHEDDSEAKGDDKSKHKKRDDSGDEKDESESHREKDKHGHENDDSNHNEDETKHHHEKQDEEGHGRREHENKRERHRRDEEKEEEDHGGKHHERWGDEEDRDRWEDEKDHDRHYKHGHNDEEEDGRHRHGRHESKEERREERREEEEKRKEERREEHEERKEERREERKERRKEEEQRKEERREERKERQQEEEQRKEERREEREARKEESGRHEKRKHHHEDREEDRELRRHEKHRHHEEECEDCGREEHERHIRHHGCGKDDDGCDSKKYYWAHSENVYPFSGGDAKIHSMVEKLARAIAQPDDPVADDRLFFTAFAQNWCEKRTPGYAELLRMIDPHSPGKWRVNGPLMNYAKFAEAFSCPVGTPMNPEKKCVIW